MEKRIAVVTHAFGASTFPMVKRLAQMGYKVDFYEICLDKITRFECFESDDIPTKNGIHSVNPAWYHGLEEYMGEVKVYFFYSKTQRPYTRIPIVRNWASWRIRRQIKHLCHHIDDKQYDCVMGVGAYDTIYYAYVYKYLRTPMVMMLHEVINHFNPNYGQRTPLMEYLLNNHLDFIVLSKNTREQVLNYPGISEQNVHLVNLGLSEINRVIPNKHIHDDLRDFVLYFGSLSPYKGINVLYDALVRHPNCLNGKKLVLAGTGSNEIVGKFQKLPNVVVINHFMPTSEMVEMIQNSYAQVMPYLSASQSGIPLAVYVFGKPIVATKISSLMDYVKDEENGLLCNINDVDDLARQLKRITSDNDLYNKLCLNVNRFELDYPDFSWDVNISKLAEVLEKNMKKN